MLNSPYNQNRVTGKKIFTNTAVTSLPSGTVLYAVPWYAYIVVFWSKNQVLSSYIFSSIPVNITARVQYPGTWSYRVTIKYFLKYPGYKHARGSF